MFVPLLKRRNTVGIRYVRGIRKDEHYEKIIEDILSVSEDEVEGLDERGDKQFMLKVSTEQKFRHICDNFIGRDINVLPGYVIKIEDISTYRLRVLVKDVPFEVTNECLRELLSDYGEVGRIDFLRRKHGKGKYSRVITGRRIVWLYLQHPIPSSLYINQTKTHIYVSHDNQTKTCNRCGQQGHILKDCKTRFENWQNVVDINLSDVHSDSESVHSDDLPTSVHSDSGSVHSVGQENESTVDQMSVTTGEQVNADIHIDSSQGKVSFECPERDYKCSYKNILEEHMQSHTGEKPFLCHVCEIEHKDMDSLEKHLETHNINESPKQGNKVIQTESLEGQLTIHTDEKPFLCLDCNVRCGSDDELQLHISSHLTENITGESDKEEQTFQCTECDYTSTCKTELNLHKKSHTGESPGKIIDQSFADIVKSPKSLLAAAVNVFTGPNTRSAGRLSSSQPSRGSEENKDSPSTSKRLRGLSLSPDYSNTTKKSALPAGKARRF